MYVTNSVTHAAALWPDIFQTCTELEQSWSGKLSFTLETWGSGPWNGRGVIRVRYAIQHPVIKSERVFEHMREYSQDNRDSFEERLYSVLMSLNAHLVRELGAPKPRG